MKQLQLRNYGVGEAVVVVVVVSDVVPVVGAGVIVVVLVVFVVLVSVEVDGEADGLTMVVLVSPGDAAGVTVSVFCSHAPRRAALARMQMYFFISSGLNGHNGPNPDSGQGMFSALQKE